MLPMRSPCLKLSPLNISLEGSISFLMQERSESAKQFTERDHMTTLPNGNPIDMDMLAIAMEDADLTNRYFLNLVTGEVIFFSDYLGLSEEDEQIAAEIDGSTDYVAIERISSHEAYQWMVDF